MGSGKKVFETSVIFDLSGVIRNGRKLRSLTGIIQINLIITDGIIYSSVYLLAGTVK